jgi:peptidoglycan hydrolase CwlO-like protein
MKRKIFLWASLVMVPLLVVSCGDTSRDDERLGETGTADEYMEDDNVFWTSDRDYTYEDRDQFREDVNEAVTKLDNEIQNLQQEADQAGEDAKQMYNERISELKSHRDNLNSKMNDFASVTEENWEDFKSGISSTWDDIENSYDQMARDIENNTNNVY